MKFNIYVLCTLVATIGYTKIVKADHNTPQLPAETSAAWYETAIKNIEKTTYRCQASEPQSLCHAVNSQQHLAFRINPSGYSVKIIPSAGRQNEWKVSFA